MLLANAWRHPLLISHLSITRDCVALQDHGWQLGEMNEWRKMTVSAYYYYYYYYYYLLPTTTLRY